MAEATCYYLNGEVQEAVVLLLRLQDKKFENPLK